MSGGFLFTGIIAPGEIKEVTVPGTTAPSTEGDYRIRVNFKDYNYVFSNYITVTVGEFLSISPTSVSKSYPADIETLSIASNVSWTVAERSAYSWITLGTTSGLDNGTCDVSISENTGSSSRTAYIDVDGTGATTKTLTITQAGAEPDSVSCDPSSLTINAGTTDSSTVTSSEGWTASLNSDTDDIISTYTTSGGDGDTLSVTMRLKMEGTYDTAIIRVSCGTASFDLAVDIIV
jgi:plastocyanin